MLLVSLISYIDRNTLALLSPAILKETGLTAEQYGWVISAFSLAYMLANPLWGKWLDRFGLRLGMLLAVSIWTVASASHAVAAGFLGFALARAMLGFGEGATFAGGLRSVLRQDPDIVMIGEIRDHETAVMAIQAALTGHLVFSTLHTNDAASAVTRLLDLGIEPYLVGSSLVGVLAQRLVRRVCGQCSRPYVPQEAELEGLRYAPGPEDRARFRKGAGCQACRGTGYHGRVGCFELLTVGEEIRGLVQSHATASDVNEAAKRAGMHCLHDDGLTKVAAGLTTLEEVMRVSMRAMS